MAGRHRVRMLCFPHIRPSRSDTLLNRGIAVLHTLPDTRERVQQELELQLALRLPLIAVRGWGDPQTAHTYTRAQALCHELGDTARLFPVLHGEWQYQLSQTDLLSARELAAQLLQLAQSAADPSLLQEAYNAQSSVFLLLGKFLTSHKHREQVEVLYSPQQHPSLVSNAVDVRSRSVFSPSSRDGCQTRHSSRR